jgi:Fe-S cluster assembly ATP-binding protein
VLRIKNLQVLLNKKNILDKIDLSIKKGETHVLMGPNGAGKSTLAQSIMGNPNYSVKGEIIFDQQNLLELDSQQRAKLGVFLSFQQILEIPGVKVYDYLKLLYKISHEKKLTPLQFKEFLKSRIAILNFNENFLLRSLNHGFSGGEKKKMEVLQMLVLEPTLIILDEIDSGLDIDAIQAVAKTINFLQKEKQAAVLLITHYAKILDFLSIDRVHILSQGKIIKSGSTKLVAEIEKKGFANFLKLFN